MDGVMTDEKLWFDRKHQCNKSLIQFLDKCLVNREQVEDYNCVLIKGKSSTFHLNRILLVLIKNHIYKYQIIKVHLTKTVYLYIFSKTHNVSLNIAKYGDDNGTFYGLHTFERTRNIMYFCYVTPLFMASLSRRRLNSDVDFDKQLIRHHRVFINNCKLR